MKSNKEVLEAIANVKLQIENIKTALTADLQASEALKAVNVVNETIENGIKAKEAQIIELENLIISLESESAKVEASELMKASLLGAMLADQTITVNFTLKTEVQLNDKGEELTNKNGDTKYQNNREEKALTVNNP